jgi:hypothetical protein
MTTLSISAIPTNAECRSVLADGRLLTITASRRPRANRADVKCTVPGAPAIAERMQEVVRLARHTEVRFDSRDQVVLSMDIAPAATERDWELAAVLADRMVRGVFLPAPSMPSASAPTPVTKEAKAALQAQGSSDAWHFGRVNGTVNDLQISHLGALTGHADPSSSVSTVRAWFPLHSGGINDTLGWVEVSVFPIESDAAPIDQSANATHVAAGAMEEDTIAAPGLDLSAQQEVRFTLAGARHFDGKALGRWRSVVRFGQPRFQGGSYQLALVMADRLARGREFVPRGRIIATGCSSAWHAGRVDTVEGREPKLELILKQLNAGDRVLLPKAWQDELPPGFAAELRQKGASLACIDRIGMI